VTEQILPVLERDPCRSQPPAERMLEIVNPHLR
jgi:hypothetical protein